MPFSFEFAEGEKALLCAGSGVVTGKEILEAKRLIESQPERTRRLARCLIAIDDAADLRITAEEVTEVARMDRGLMPETLSVAVVAPADHAFGIARMWETLASDTGWRIRVFRKQTDADAWLDLPIS